MPSDLGGRGGGQEEDLGGDRLGLQVAGMDLGAVLPERGGLGLVEILDDQPVELRQRLPLIAGVLAADGGVLAHREEPFDLALGHRDHHRHVRMVADDLGQPVVPPVVLLGRRSPRRTRHLSRLTMKLGKLAQYEVGDISVLMYSARVSCDFRALGMLR